MWRPTDSLPRLVITAIHWLYQWTVRLTYAISARLTRLFEPYLPTGEEARSYAVLWWRRYSGFSATFFLAVLPALSFMILQDRSIIPSSSVNQSTWELTYIEFATLMTRVLFVGFFAVYFLRVLYWFQRTLPRFWNRVTPPHVPEGEASKAEEAGRTVPEIFADAERNTRKWFGGGLLFFFGTLSLLLIIGVAADQTGTQDAIQQQVAQAPAEEGFLQSVTELLEILPLVGDLYSFAGELPGENAFEKFLLNGTALFFAVALRNWAYLFEHMDHVWRNVGWVRPFRYRLYTVFYAFSILLITPVLLILIAAELALI